MSQKNDSLQQVNLTELEKLLPVFYDKRIPLYLWGRPSTGKTSIIRQFAQQKAKGLNLEYSEDKFGDKYFTLKVITLSQFDSPDLRGMPKVIENESDRSKSYTEFIPTSELPREGQGILFFDEMNLADDTTRAACYQIILEGRYGCLPPVMDIKGKHAFWRVAASNTENDFCSVNTSSLALLRRFCHLSVMPTYKEVVDYFTKLGLDFRIPAFLSSFPEDLFPQKFDEKLVDNKANPFPSTWQSLAVMIDKINDENLIYSLAASCIGAPVASKFLSFVKMIGLLDMNKIIKDPETEIKAICKMQEKPSLLYATVYSIGNSWLTRDRKLNAQQMADIGNQLPPEFSVTFAQIILHKRTQELTANQDFHKMMIRIGVFFEEI